TFAAPVACFGLLALLTAVSEFWGELGRCLVAVILGGFILGWLACFCILAAYAWLRRDERARIVWLLVLAWVVLGAVLTATLALQASPNGWLAALAIIAYLLGLAALLLFAMGLYVERRTAPAFAAAGIVL